MSETQTVQTPSNPFGIEFVPASEVPDPPRRVERNTDLYKALKTLLEMNPGNWAKARTFDKPGAAGSIAAQIRAGNNKLFPPSKGWTARSEKTVANEDKTEGTSTLYVGYKVSDAPVVEETGEDSE